MNTEHNSRAVRLTLNPEVRVIDANKGTVEYIASDESVDSYKEVVRADGWRFSRFEKNAPFVNSHRYGSVEDLLGKVLDFEVKGRRLVETVQWAKDVPENKLAQLGWRMTEAGYLKAVSVGFFPVRMVTKWDQDPTQYVDQLRELKMDKKSDDMKPRVVYLEQEQVELSAVIIGANQNALAKAYKAGVLSDLDLDTLSDMTVREQDSRVPHVGAQDTRQRARRRERFIWMLNQHLKDL